MSKNRLVMAFAGLLLCSLFCGNAQASRVLASQGSPYIVDAWGIEDGLPQSSVISIAQTHDGYLWLGTLNGLVRFDGMKFTLFDESNTPGLNSSRVLHLFEDSSRDLWVGTERGVVLIGKNGELRNFDFGQETGGGRYSMCEDSSGTVWVLKTDTGLLGRYNAGVMNLASARCKAVIAEKSGPVWLGTDQAMVALQKTPANSPAFVVEQMVPVNSQLDFILASQSGGYWRLADGRVQKWKGDRREKDFGSYPWGSRPVSAACEDLEGNLIVGTYGDGVYWFQPNKKVVHLVSELSHPSILSVMMDREGNLWIGTNGGGLNRVKRKVFHTLAESEGFVVQSVCEDREGGLWIGYNGESRVDYRRAGTTRTFKMVQDPSIAPNCDVKSVFVDQSQRVWAGTWFNGDPRQLPFRLFQFEEGKFQARQTAATNNVSALYQDRAGGIWIGFQTGLARVDEKGWTFFSTDVGLAGNEVRAICEDSSGTLWVATGTGLSRWLDGRFTSLHKADGLPSDDLSCMYPDRDGALWVGTRGSGLARFYKDHWTHYTTSEGLIGNSIGYLLEDGEANFWIGSNAGLMRVAKKSLNDFANGVTSEVSCRAYGEAEGLPTRECTQGSQPAACRAANGTLWFPTAKGLVSIDPTTLRKNAFQPPVIIESIVIEGEKQATNRLRTVLPRVIVVPPGKEHLEIHYTSLNLGAAEQSRFRYRLEGHEKWNEVGNIREARYSKLPPGNYLFEVTAANEDGIWNPIATVQEIRIQPPYWKEPWFVTVASLVTIALLVGIVHYFSTQKLQQEVALFKQHEALEKERARIARDLHDQLGANLMQVALLGELAEADKASPNDVEEHAKQIYETARETTKALDEIVWAVNPSNDTLDGLVNYICKYAQEYFEIAGLRYRIEVPPELPKVIIPPEVRHNVFLAAKEAVNNVVKHAGATSAWLRLNLEPDQFTLEIEDNGKGLAGMETKTGRNGLRNMRKRLEDVGGKFAIAAAPEKGAVVRLTTPIQNR
ncbi:MAG: two-component regulator propeller domain-containing protein [Verrucomicrobiota bacterium]